jgi:hypothetical protein
VREDEVGRTMTLPSSTHPRQEDVSPIPCAEWCGSQQCLDGGRCIRFDQEMVQRGDQPAQKALDDGS